MPTKLPIGQLGQKATHSKANSRRKATKKELFSEFSIDANHFVHYSFDVIQNCVFSLQSKRFSFKFCFIYDMIHHGYLDGALLMNPIGHQVT